MDIRSKAIAATTVLHLKDVDDEPMYDEVDGKQVPVEVVLFTPASKEYQKATAAKNNRLMDRVRKKKQNMSADAMVEERAEFLTEVTKQFNNMSYPPLEGEAMINAIYADTSIGFIADQVERHLSDWANFSKSAPSA